MTTTNQHGATCIKCGSFSFVDQNIGTFLCQSCEKQQEQQQEQKRLVVDQRPRVPLVVASWLPPAMSTPATVVQQTTSRVSAKEEDNAHIDEYYGCQHCALMFVQRSKLVKHHKMIHAEELDFGMRMIRRKSTDPFVCPECPKSFGNNRGFATHYTMAHNLPRLKEKLLLQKQEQQEQKQKQPVPTVAVLAPPAKENPPPSPLFLSTDSMPRPPAWPFAPTPISPTVLPQFEPAPPLLRPIQKSTLPVVAAGAPVAPTSSAVVDQPPQQPTPKQTQKKPQPIAYYPARPQSVGLQKAEIQQPSNVVSSTAEIQNAAAGSAAAFPIVAAPIPASAVVPAADTVQEMALTPSKRAFSAVAPCDEVIILDDDEEPLDETVEDDACLDAVALRENVVYRAVCIQDDMFLVSTGKWWSDLIRGVAQFIVDHYIPLERSTILIDEDNDQKVATEECNASEKVLVDISLEDCFVDVALQAAAGSVAGWTEDEWAEGDLAVEILADAVSPSLDAQRVATDEIDDTAADPKELVQELVQEQVHEQIKKRRRVADDGASIDDANDRVFDDDRINPVDDAPCVTKHVPERVLNVATNRLDAIGSSISGDTLLSAAFAMLVPEKKQDQIDVWVARLAAPDIEIETVHDLRFLSNEDYTKVYEMLGMSSLLDAVLCGIRCNVTAAGGAKPQENEAEQLQQETLQSVSRYASTTVMSKPRRAKTMKPIKLQRRLANAINAIGEPHWAKAEAGNRWWTYGELTISALERFREGRLLNLTEEPTPTSRLIDALDSLQHAPALCNFVSLNGQTNSAAEGDAERRVFRDEFFADVGGCIATWQSSRNARINGERDVSEQSGADLQNSLRVKDRICQAVGSAIYKFNNRRLSGEKMQETLIDILVSTNALVEARRLALCGRGKEALRLLAVIGDVVQALHKGYPDK